MVFQISENPKDMIFKIIGNNAKETLPFYRPRETNLVRNEEAEEDEEEEEREK